MLVKNFLFLSISLVSSLCSVNSLGNTILILGDSISAAYGINPEQGWVMLLDEKLNVKEGKTYRVINASVSGNTTADGLGRLPPLLKEFQPSIVIVELGGNDGLRGYPIKLIERNLDRIITLSKQSGAKILLAGMEIPPNYGQRYTKAFRNGFANVAKDIPKKKNRFSFLPFMLKDVGTDPRLMQKDGIHPTVEAQPMILNNVWPYLKPLL
jgi:acyl-CoA thioesterase-1